MNGWFSNLSYKARKRWALFILVVGLPAYIVVAVTITSTLERPSFLTELAIYVGLGILWAYPFRSIFKGIGQADPDARGAEGDDADRDHR